MYGTCIDYQSSKGKLLIKKYYDSNILDCILEPDFQIGGIYLGNIEAAKNQELLRKLRIKAILTIGSRPGLKFNDQLFPYHEVIMIEDHISSNMKQYFEKIFNFIEQSRVKTNILIYCFSGISRSSTAVIMYLMKKFDWTYEKAYYFCKTKRPIVCPNESFKKQLIQYETERIEDKIDQNILTKSQSLIQRNLNQIIQKNEVQKQIISPSESKTNNIQDQYKEKQQIYKSLIYNEQKYKTLRQSVQYQSINLTKF